MAAAFVLAAEGEATVSADAGRTANERDAAEGGRKAATSADDAMPPDAAAGGGRIKDAWGAKPSARK